MAAGSSTSVSMAGGVSAYVAIAAREPAVVVFPVFVEFVVG